MIRRELAGYLVTHNREAYLALCRRAFGICAEIQSRSEQEQTQMLQELSSKYPDYESFDLSGVKEYVLAHEVLGDYFSFEEVENHYLEIIKFQCLSQLVDNSWRFRPGPLDFLDIDHLERGS